MTPEFFNKALQNSKKSKSGWYMAEQRRLEYALLLHKEEDFQED
jgi:hypothetical protein